jgi:hypothetical protein
MKALRGFAWLLTLAAISLPAERLYAQQEIDPDHYEQQATAAQVQKAAPHNPKHAQVKVASKAKHHHRRAAA